MECDYFLYGCGDAIGDQDLAILRLSTEPSGQVAHDADSGIAGALGKADLAKRRVALPRRQRANAARRGLLTPAACARRMGRFLAELQLAEVPIGVGLGGGSRPCWCKTGWFEVAIDQAASAVRKMVRVF